MTEKVTELLENASECDVSGVFENSILKKIPTEQCISTGITLLNLNLSGNKDGGFRKGSLVQLLAETGVGKTLFGSYVMKTAIENPNITHVLGAEYGIKGVLNDRLFFVPMGLHPPFIHMMSQDESQKRSTLIRKKTLSSRMPGLL